MLIHSSDSKNDKKSSTLFPLKRTLRDASRTLLAATLLSGIFGLESQADSWPQWRGSNRDGSFTGPIWPNDLSSLQLKWERPVDDGYPGPVVNDSRVFTVETLRKSNEVVRCFDRSTGEELWSRSWEGAMRVPFFAASNGSWVRSTPVIDEEFIYVAGMRDVLVCLSQEDGSEAWRRDFVKELGTPLPSFGFVCSPLMDGEFLYVQAGASLMKLRKKDGETVWRSLVDAGGMNGSAFSSPVLASIHGVTQLLVQTRTELHGVDPESGRSLWSQKIPAFRGMNILPPTPVENSIFTSAYGGKSLLINISRTAENSAVSWSSQLAWENKVEGYMSSPIVVDGYIYMHLKNKKFACMDLQTGEVKWETDRKFGMYWSMVNQGSKLLALDESGSLFLIEASPERFILLDEKKISKQPTWAHLGMADNQLFIRGQKSIALYKWDANARVAQIQ